MLKYWIGADTTAKAAMAKGNNILGSDQFSERAFNFYLRREKVWVLRRSTYKQEERSAIPSNKVCCDKLKFSPKGTSATLLKPLAFRIYDENVPRSPTRKAYFLSSRISPEQ